MLVCFLYFVKKYQNANKIYVYNHLNGLHRDHVIKGPLNKPVRLGGLIPSTLIYPFNKLVI